MLIAASVALPAGIYLGGQLIKLGPQKKTHSFPADLSSQTATAAVESYVREGFIKGDQVKSVEVSFDGIVDTPLSFNGIDYTKAFRYFVNYTYIQGLSFPGEDICTKYFLVTFDCQKEQWIVYDDNTRNGLLP